MNLSCERERVPSGLQVVGDSSLSSWQCGVPSHIQSAGIHIPFLHLDPPGHTKPTKNIVCAYVNKNFNG